MAGLQKHSRWVHYCVNEEYVLDNVENNSKDVHNYFQIGIYNNNNFVFE